MVVVSLSFANCRDRIAKTRIILKLSRTSKKIKINQFLVTIASSYIELILRITKVNNFTYDFCFFFLTIFTNFCWFKWWETYLRKGKKYFLYISKGKKLLLSFWFNWHCNILKKFNIIDNSNFQWNIAFYSNFSRKIISPYTHLPIHLWQ